MRHFLALLFLAAGLAYGQAADCQFTVTFTGATAQSPAFNNKPTTTGGQTPCTSWVVTYWTNGATGVSLALQGAPDSSGSPGSYSNLTAISSSANPATGTQEGNVLACCDYYPWIRVNATTFNGTSKTMIVRVYGYRNNNVARGGGGGGTIAATTNALKGDGAGNAVAVTGTGTNCVLVNGSSAACSSTTGNAASLVAYTPAANVTLTCPSATAGTVTVFAPNAALSANMALTYAGCTTGQILVVRVLQAGSGGPYTVSGLPSGAPQISPIASSTTIYLLHATGATSVSFDNVAGDSGPGVITESAAPGTPPSTYGYLWADSTNHVLSFINPSGTVSNTAVPQTCSANQAFTAMSAAGAYTCAAITAAPSGSAGGDLSGTYPNPTVAKVNGASVPTSQSYVGTNSSGQIIAAATPTSGALVLIEQHAASSSATLDFTACFSSTYDDYQFDVVNLVTSTANTQLQFLVSTNGGSTWQGSNYNWGLVGVGSTGSSNTSQTEIRMLDSTGARLSGVVKLYAPLGSNEKLEHGEFAILIAAGAPTGSLRVQAGTWGTTTAVNAVRFQPAAGTFTSGNIRCYGIAK